MSAGRETLRDPRRLIVVALVLAVLGLATVVGAPPAGARSKPRSTPVSTPAGVTPSASTTRSAARIRLRTTTTTTTMTAAPGQAPATAVAAKSTVTAKGRAAGARGGGSAATVTARAGGSAGGTTRRSGRVRTASVIEPHRASTRQDAAVATAATAAQSPSTPVIAPPSIATDCSSDVSQALAAWLNSLPAGSSWTPPPGACYLVSHGMTLRFLSDVSINGGLFEDLNTTAPAKNGGATEAGNPAFTFLGGADVTLANLSIVGAHNGWSYRPALAFQAGIELEGTEGATVHNVSVTKTFGDGLNLEPLRGGADYRSGGIVNPVESLAVSDLTIKQAGRQGITPASVNGATFTDVTVTGVAFNAWDFESDQKNEGAKNVTVDGCIFSGINIAMDGPATGPITFQHCTMLKVDHGDAVRVQNVGHRPLNGPIVLDDVLLRCGASVYVSCVQLGGASDVTVKNSTLVIGFRGDAIHEAAYTANNSSHVTFTDDVVHGFGQRGATHNGSTATVTGGVWTGRGCRWPAVCPSH